MSTEPNLAALGFELEPKPEEHDPGHFYVRPGPLHIEKGWTLEDWANTRNTMVDLDETTWHPLTALLWSFREQV